MNKQSSPVPGPSDVAAPIAVKISAVIESEFKRRSIFPALRLERAYFRDGSTGTHRVSVEQARELLADAKAMRPQGRSLPRGVPAAYSVLAKNVAQALAEEEARQAAADDAERGARQAAADDPGRDEALKRMTVSPACFSVGDKALFFSAGAERGVEVTVVRGYGLHTVRDPAGPYVSRSSGKRINYLLGYVVARSGDSWFCRAFDLTRGDCRPSHLCLVPSRREAAVCC